MRVTKMMRNVISFGSKKQPRIFVEKDETTYVVPYWISKKGNLCWQIGEVLYVKNRWGFTSMLVNGKWAKSDATTKATASQAEEHKNVEPFRGSFSEV